MSVLLDLDPARLGRCPNCDRWMEFVCNVCRDFDHSDLLDRVADEARRLREGIRAIAVRRCLCEGHWPSSAPHGGPCCGVAGGLCVTCSARALLDAQRCPTCGAGDGDEHDLDQHETGG